MAAPRAGSAPFLIFQLCQGRSWRPWHYPARALLQSVTCGVFVPKLSASSRGPLLGWGVVEVRRWRGEGAEPGHGDLGGIGVVLGAGPLPSFLLPPRLPNHFCTRRGLQHGRMLPPPMPPGPELHKSAAGAGPNLFAVSPDLASICERWSARALLHLFLPPRLNQRLGRLLAALSGITGGAPGSSLLLASAQGAEITRQQRQLTATPCACFTEQTGARGTPNPALHCSGCSA